ncbi:hypothetical protein BX266_6531 [Streptomyces sp. TLI_171]|nr:hypothetical protein BX266_6531 [Streptomyces sp. TLI_171]
MPAPVWGGGRGSGAREWATQCPAAPGAVKSGGRRSLTERQKPMGVRVQLAVGEGEPAVVAPAEPHGPGGTPGP